jgi:UDPglucose 6-dehydrogenase
MREAPSVVIIEGLLSMGAEVSVYDPEAMSEASHILGDSVGWADNGMAALNGADALVLVTEWHEFRNPNWSDVASAMRQKIVFDGRNIYDPEALRSMDFEIHSVGRP